MKILNLAYPEKSDIRFHDGLGNIGKTALFPDGQQQVVINPKCLTGYIDTDSETEYWKEEKVEKVQIKSRLNNFQDLELIVCATKSLRNLGVKEIHLYTPYFLGSRSDRQFEEGSNNYLKDVICPIINSLNFESVTVLDPHSDVLEACLNNFIKLDNRKLIALAFCSIYKSQSVDLNNAILVSPDAGASKKIYKLADHYTYKGEIITCSKDRDVNGKLTKTIVPHAIIVDNPDKDLIIIDDICDGGTTFINIAKFIKENYGSIFNSKIYLIITHGIFSKGFEELSKYFDGIYCTNSYKDVRLNQPINDILGADPKLVKQLNVF